MKTTVCLLTAVAVAALLPLNAAANPPKAGDPAPLVTGKDQNGKAWSLAQALKKNAVLLYFYPKDDTPGCTKQACGLRDQMGSLKQKGVEVVGVSFDNAESHQKFISKYELNFNLLADTDGKIAEAFGVKNPTRNIAQRASFLIGKDGKIVHAVVSPSADENLKQMTEALAKLKH
jgi:peroxiredoxin Q/BCP